MDVANKRRSLYKKKIMSNGYRNIVTIRFVE